MPTWMGLREREAEGSPQRVFSKRLSSTSHCFPRSPSSSTAHTKLFLSLSITLSLSVSFLIHPLKTNELHSCLRVPGVKMKQHFPGYTPYLPAEYVCMNVCVCKSM